MCLSSSELELPLAWGIMQNVHLWSHPFCIWTKALVLLSKLFMKGGSSCVSSITSLSALPICARFINVLDLVLSSFPMTISTSGISMNSDG